MLGGERTGRDGARSRPVASPVVPTNELEAQALPISRLSALLEIEGVATREDFARLLQGFFAPSFELLTDDWTVVTSLERVFQFTVEADRGGRTYRVPDPEGTAEDGPVTEVVLFEGEMGDFLVTGRLFVAGQMLVLDLEWWGNDGRILLAESLPRPIGPTSGDGSAAGDGAGTKAKKYSCKCSHPSGACSITQCDRHAGCWSGATCEWRWNPA